MVVTSPEASAVVEDAVEAVSVEAAAEVLSAVEAEPPQPASIVPSIAAAHRAETVFFMVFSFY